MSLKSLLGSENNQGERKFRCPQCRQWIRVSRTNVDFVHRNCTTKYKAMNNSRTAAFRHELLAQGKSLLSGMLTEPPNSPNRKDKSIDTEEVDDCYVELD